MDIITKNKTQYNQWCDKKIANFTSNLDDLFVEITDPTKLSKPERDKIIKIISQNNLCFFELQKPVDVEKKHIRLLADSVGMSNYESCNTSDEYFISEISNKTEHDIVGEYIPYTNKALNWHTDGYYNPITTPILSWMLYCMNPAEEGGINKFLDHELLYIYFNKESERIEELMDKSAYCIPKNEAIGRADEYGYIFNFIKDKLHMRFTMRMKNIIWKDEVKDLVGILKKTIEKLRRYQIECKLQKGQGVFTNNVLHMRTSFKETYNDQRLLLRMRAGHRIE
tara:strand:- start:1112 stop:1957 length:846 start_codon:yes stop_codon:yes gene_type:complete